jgi:hypothetical protein
VTAGLKVVTGGGQSIALDGEKEAIQIHVEFAPAGTYDATRTERENDSRSPRERANIYLLGRTDPEAEQLAIVIFRCGKFLDKYRTASDPETQEFTRIIDGRLGRTTTDLERRLQTSLMAGSFVAHGTPKAVSECGADVLDAAKSYLAEAAARVFDRYGEAAHQADSGLAEKFLKTPLDRITTNEDPLGLVTRSGGRAQIKTDYRAIVSIKDYLGQQGQVEGRRVLDYFAEPPFGWSKDTTRYLLAGAFLGTEIKLRIAGADHLVKNDDTLAAFSSNRQFNAVGIALRQERPDPDSLMRASDRLCNLTGENILPLEDVIAAAAKKHFPEYQATFASLAIELSSLGLDSAAQVERAENLAGDLTEVVRGDGSDAVKRLGGADSPLYDSLVWARKVKTALDNGLRTALKHLQRVQQEIADLPDSGIPGKLKSSAAENLDSVSDILSRDSFFNEAPSLTTLSSELDKLIASATGDLAQQQKDIANGELSRWQASSDWADLTDEDRAWLNAEVDKLAIEPDGSLDGMKKTVRNDFSLNSRLRDLAETVVKKAAENRAGRSTQTATTGGTTVEVSESEIVVPKVFKSSNQIDLLIAELNKLRARISAFVSVRIKWKEID